MQVGRAAIRIGFVLDEPLARAESQLPLSGARREIREADQRVLVVGLVRQRPLERLEGHRNVDQAIGVDQAEPVAQRLEHLGRVLEPRALHERLRGFLPVALLPRDVGDRGVCTQIVAIRVEDGAVVHLRGVAIRQEVAMQLGERAVQLDLRGRVGLDGEAVREQRGEVVVVRVFLEEDAQPQEAIAVPRIGLERAAERRHRLLADERLVHQRHAGEVVERGTGVEIVGAASLPRGRLGDIDPQLALERGLAPAFERGRVTRHRSLGAAELLHGRIDLFEIGERLAGAGPERGLALRIAFEVVGDRLLEIRELLREAFAAHERLEVEQRHTVLGLGPKRGAIDLGDLGIRPIVARGQVGDVDEQRGAVTSRLVGGDHRLEHGAAEPEELADLILGRVLALEAMQQIDAARLGLRGALERDLGRPGVGAELAIDVREELVRVGLRDAVAGGLGGLQARERERGDRSGIAQLGRDPDERHGGERIAGT